MELEGHTEAGRPPRDEAYTSWELSTDRANTARRILLEHGVKLMQVRKIAGFAETKPLLDMDGTDERNRRVTVLLRVQNQLD
jgi:chemotaxis protein MotB